MILECQRFLEKSLIETFNYFKNVKTDNNSEKIVENFISRKNIGTTYLSLFALIFLLGIFLNRSNIFFNFFSFFEIIIY